MTDRELTREQRAAMAAIVERILAPARSVVDPATKAVENATKALAPLKRAAEQARIAEEFADLLLCGDSSALNRRAEILAKCPKGQVAYRAFRLPSLGLLGVPAGPHWLGGQAQRWVARMEWLNPPPDDTVVARCRCHRSLPPLAVERIHEGIAAGLRSIPVVLR